MTFSISIANLINLFMVAMGIGVSGLSIIQISKAPIRRQVRKYFVFFLWMLITYITMFLVRLLLGGLPGQVIRIILYVVVFIEFMVSAIMVVMLGMMIVYIAVPEDKAKKYVNILIICLILHEISLVMSQFRHRYYYFDEFNVYHRGGLYLISNLFPLLIMIQGVYLLIKHKDKFTRRVAIAFWIYLLAPFAAMVVQAFYSEVKFIIIATVCAAVNMFAVIIDDLTRKYEKQQLEASRIETELSMATRIQADMLPNIFPAFPDRPEFDIYATMDPAKEVGGDFYDFFLVDEDHLGIVMADVSGKGVPAALFMMASKILIQNYAMMYKDPKLALEAANKQICQNNREDMFVTVWLGIIDLTTGTMEASNAGHEWPAIKFPGGKFELFKDTHGFVVGGMSGVKYKKYELEFEKGTMLYIYTDGVAEATNANNELFGSERLVEALNSASEDTPEAVLESVDRAVGEFVKNESQFDDLTMLCFKYNGKE